MKFNLDHKNLKIDDGWGGNKDILFGDSKVIQAHANSWNDTFNNKNTSKEAKKKASEVRNKIQELFLEGLDLKTLIEAKKKISIFSLRWESRMLIPHYYYEEGKKIKYFFIAEAITYPTLPIVFDENPFSNENDNFKKKIIENLDPNKNEWRHLADLEIPSGMFCVCDKSYYQDQQFNKDVDKNIFNTIKKMKIYAVISDRKKLIEDYNGQMSEGKLIDEDYGTKERTLATVKKYGLDIDEKVLKTKWSRPSFFNLTLPEEKIGHGIMIC